MLLVKRSQMGSTILLIGASTKAHMLLAIEVFAVAMSYNLVRKPALSSSTILPEGSEGSSK